MNTAQLTHSVSSCRDYDLCPRRYRFGYLDREPPRRHVPPAWRVGSAVHAALEASYRHLRLHGPAASVEDRITAAVTALHVAWEQLDLAGRASLGEAVMTVRRFIADERIDGGEIVGVEQLLATTSEGLRIAGYADLLLRRGDELEIRDHKVTRWERSPDELSEDFQLGLYGWLATEMWPWVRSVRAGHCYPLSGRVVVVPLEATAMTSAAERVRETAGRIAGDEVFAPDPGEHCTSCAWADLCPAWPPPR